MEMHFAMQEIRSHTPPELVNFFSYNKLQNIVRCGTETAISPRTTNHFVLRHETIDDQTGSLFSRLDAGRRLRIQARPANQTEVREASNRQAPELMIPKPQEHPSAKWTM